MIRAVAILILIAAQLASAPARAQGGFAALVSPPRFELATRPGKVLRGVFEISNRATTPATYLLHTADWTLARDFGVTFQEDLQEDSCRPWVSIERPEVTVPGAGTMRYRFEIAVPADARDGECRFAILIEGADPAIARSAGLDLPVSGRIGVIVYAVIGSGAPQIEILGPKVTNVNGKDVPTLRVHNAGNAHGRMAGFLTGVDAKGTHYDIIPSDFPILPGEEREVFLMPSTATEEHPTVAFPITVRGRLESGDQKIDLDQRFE